MTIIHDPHTGVGSASSLKRILLGMLVLLTLFLAAPLTAYAAEESGFSDELWHNGKYSSSLGDMAGRRLYVYGIVDSADELPEDIKRIKAKCRINRY